MIKKKIECVNSTLMQRSRRVSLQMLAACGFLVGAGMMQSCDKDILEGQPEWLGNSIYERLEEGIEVNGQKLQFNYTLNLIKDLKYDEVLSHTGSRTLFVASDAEYDKWFQNNTWGVTSYEQLNNDQKKELFNGTMIKNAYLLELMSNVPSTSDTKDPETGMAMRRETARSVYDNVPVMKVANFPQNEQITDDPVNTAWNTVRTAGKDIHILKDATAAPMIHFLPEFMKKNNITDGDLQVISNGASQSRDDSWVNGRKVISPEQTCKNGYVYVVDGVMASSPNMAQIINENSKTKLWARMLNRFSVPVRLSYNEQLEFWRLFPDLDKVDSLYTLRYLNQSGNHALLTPNNQDYLTETGTLKFDPGWNQFKANNSQVIMQNDAAAMLVPTDEDLIHWFKNDGRALYDKFNPAGNENWETFIDCIPYETLVKLLNVNMQESFVATVPSKFASILDDAQRCMNVSIDNIEECIMGCNGVVYITNTVFAPSEYSSVLFPALTQSSDNFGVAYHALTSNYNSGYITNNGSAQDFSPYLSAMDSRFTLIIPYNKYESENKNIEQKVMRYIDPCSYGLPQQTVMEFYYETGKDDSKISCVAYPATMGSDGKYNIDYNKPTTVTSASTIANRLFDLIDNSIIIGDITPNQKYYKTKAGSVMYAEGNNETGMTFQGGYQLLNGERVYVPHECIYAIDKGNGVTYGVSGDPDVASNVIDVPMTSSKSVYDVLKAEKERQNGDSLFYNLLFTDVTKGALYGTKDGTSYCANPTGNNNITVFDNYNYTVFVPSDAKIKELIDSGALPTWEDYENAATEEDKEKIADKIHQFLRYHIQDNAVYLGSKNIVGEMYETALLNKANNRFYTLSLTQDGNSMQVKDFMGNVHNVVKSMCNVPCREYWLSGQVKAGSSQNVMINSSSNAVIHKIDGVLVYGEEMLKNWRY